MCKHDGMSIQWKSYKSPGFFDELLLPSGRARSGAGDLCRLLASMDRQQLAERKSAAELAIRTMGITFTVYSDTDGSIDREWPFDIIPRIIQASEWDRIEAGLKQRVKALNRFIDDIYHDQQILHDGVVDAEVIKNSKDYRPECNGISPPHGVWSHICGSDLVRDENGDPYVLEDNLRVPSGVAYMLENRQVMKRVLPELFAQYLIRPVDHYPTQLYECLSSLSEADKPTIAVLTPGIYNSAYFEHAYLAQEMGALLVEGSDLTVGKDEKVYARTISGLAQVDVIYRRIDDMFIDPKVFNPDSMLGVAGLMGAWQKGNVALANAPGCGVADDKLVYTYVPEIIRYYLNEEPLLSNVPSYRCNIKEEREYVLNHLDELVVKPVSESGGYGMLIGPKARPSERRAFAKKIRQHPRNFIAQPMLALSTAPALIGSRAEPRHLDLRPFVLSGADTAVTAGGLTRVAMVKGSIVVNSSQGGGSKDTWIVGGNSKGDKA
ncbi:MAG: circularly permuted type 2 ATP-grasp protein [Lysobacterales bacterium]